MPLCESLSILVELTMSESTTATSEDKAWASVLRSIATYRDRKRLDEWEAEVNRISPRLRTTPLQQMLGELEMLGMSNLYQAFNIDRTIAFYDRLRPYFAERGVKLPISVDLGGW
jgi:hypothetical protein